MSGIVQDEAFVSLATNNGYALGALVLGHSLRSANTNRQLVLMITRNVHPQVRQELLTVWDRLSVVDVFDSQDASNLALLGRPDLGITFTKLHAWKLTEYRKCVFLDSDALVLQNIDDLFDRPEISAAPDIGWPDCFNSGVFVFVPSLATYEALIAHALVHGSFDGGDQGLLNSYFSNWSQLGATHRLPFTYNLHSNNSYSYSPAYQRFQHDVKVVHFLGARKPWHYSINLESGEVLLNQGDPQDTASREFVQRWWDVYREISRNVLDNADHITDGEDHSGRMPHIPAQCDESNDLGTDNDMYDGAPTYGGLPQIIIDSPEGTRDYYEHNHSYSTSTQSTSTSTPSESHEIRQLASGIANIYFRDLADEQQQQQQQQQQETSSASHQATSGQARWEYGQIDYVGIDSFDNILIRLQESLADSNPITVIT